MAVDPLTELRGVSTYVGDPHVTRDVDLDLFAHEPALRNASPVQAIVRGRTAFACAPRPCRRRRPAGHVPGAAPGRPAAGATPSGPSRHEPARALDPEEVSEVLEVMRQPAHEGTAMIVCRHEKGFTRSASKILEH